MITVCRTALPTRLRIAATLLLVACCVQWNPSLAQAPPPGAAPKGKPAVRPAVAPVPAAGDVKPYRIEKLPAWVKAPPALATVAAGGQAGARARREVLLDLQVQIALGTVQQQLFLRHRRVALDAATLGEVSKSEIYFNPAYQTLQLHEAAVHRNGARLDRLKDARIEILRREQQLEKQVIDGLSTALVVLNDVRVGDVVDVAYTVLGANPIFKGRYAALFQLASDAPIDVLSLRVEYPAARSLNTRTLRLDIAPEHSVENGRKVMRLTRRDVAPIQSEQATPPWFKVYPALHVSEYGSWNEVDAWARELFSAPPIAAGSDLAQRIADWRAQNLAPDALIDAVLNFVQEDVRYFSVSLGESSHRPKPPAQTLAERLGDCKDKVALLNAVLREFGIDARPALVSMERNRGVGSYLPSHDQFDHVISRVVVGEKTWWLDPTITGQGRKLDRRGVFRYGVALVVGAGDELTAVDPAADAAALAFGPEVRWLQRWDLSDPKQPAQLKTVMTVQGFAAERWRGALSGAGTERIGESIGGAYARVLPGLTMTGAPVVRDNLDDNQLEIEVNFTHPAFGKYTFGAIDVEFAAVELLDLLVGPPEAKRQTPFWNNQPRRAVQTIEVLAPRPFTLRAPAPAEVADRHFLYQWRMEASGSTARFVLSYDMRRDEVLPADLDTFRGNLLRARQMSGGRLRLALVDTKSIEPGFAEIDRRIDRSIGSRRDALREIMIRHEVGRLLATESLRVVGDASPLTAGVLVDRAIAASTLGEHANALADADRALALKPDLADAHRARGVSLVSLDRLGEALPALQKAKALSNDSAHTQWVGTAHYYLGQYRDAVALLREAIDQGAGEDRDFALIWLFFAAERASGNGRATIAPLAASSDPQRWPGQLLRFVDGRISQDELLRAAAREKERERLNLAEAYFFIGKSLALRGDSLNARRMYEKAIDIKALPYREHALAEVELKRLGR